MADPSGGNSRVSLRDHMNLRFDALERRLDDYCKKIDQRLEDHEQRIRAQEKQTPWRTVAESITGILAIVAVGLGLRPK